LDYVVNRAAPRRDRELLLLLGGAGFFKALVAAHELGLFRFLSAHPGASQADVAVGCGLPLPSTRTLLMTTCALRLTERDAAGGYRNVEWVNGGLAGDRPTYPTILSAIDQLMYQPFTRLTEALRRGTNAGLEVFPGPGTTLYERLAAHPEHEAIFHAWMSNLSSAGLPEAVMEAFAGSRHLLDAGGGDGTNAILLARAHPELRVTVLDLPSICERARAHVEACHLSDRISAQPCDIRVDPFPEGADGILFSRIFNIYSEEQNRAFVRKAADALPPGGRLVVFPSQVSDDDEQGPLSAAFLSLYFLCLATGEGRVYPPSAYEAWFRDAGFTSLQGTVDELDNAVFVGRK
jgi:hypothetical protein